MTTATKQPAAGTPATEKSKECQRCKSDRVFRVWTHAQDKHVVNFKQYEHCDYLPQDMGVANRDGDATFEYCLACGQIQGKWPLPETKIEQEQKHEMEKTKTVKPAGASPTA